MTEEQKQRLIELKEKAISFDGIVKNIISYGDNDPTSETENKISETEDYKASLKHWKTELSNVLAEIKQLEPAYDAISIG